MLRFLCEGNTEYFFFRKTTCIYMKKKLKSFSFINIVMFTVEGIIRVFIVLIEEVTKVLRGL